ncbi:MAG: glycoside hydrolase family 32 protein [Verrucomicrobiia bacterium]
MNFPETRLLLALGCCSVVAVAQQPDIVIGVFEGKDLDGWQKTGDAFLAAPFRPGAGGRFSGFEGNGVAWSGRGGLESAGTLLSPEFGIQRKFINFLVAGERNLPATVGVELVVDGRVVRAASATETFDPAHALQWRTWDVRDLAGRKARIRVNDSSATGAIAVDQFAQSDAQRTAPADATTLLQESFRPQFHFTAKTGWLNDANGMLHYKGQWHLFHQHRPPSSSATVWGHAVSDDLLHWRHLPTAIPCEGRDAIFSGSGLVDVENASGLKRGDNLPLLFFYTLHPASDSGRKSTQCMAFSTDAGHTFEKYSSNPILRTHDNNDRDPKVFWHKPTRMWFMVLSLSRNNTDRDRASYGLFRSRDLKSWDLIQEIGPGAWYWECPDLFELPLDGDASRTKWLLTKGSGDYIVGTFDGERFKAETEPIRTSWGASYYGAQTFDNTPGGRRIQVGWMNSGPKAEVPNAYPGMPFNQQMSFPRELTLRTTTEGPRVFRQPVAEIEKLYAKTRVLKSQALQPGDNPLADVRHDLLDIELELEPGQARQVTLNMRGAEVRYDVKEAKLKVFDRALALPLSNGRLVLRVLLDLTSIELYGNGGAVTHAKVFFPDPANRAVALTASGGPAHILHLAVRELRSIWSTVSER